MARLPGDQPPEAVTLVGIGYLFTDQLTSILADVHSIERWLALAALLGGDHLGGDRDVAMWRRGREI